MSWILKEISGAPNIRKYAVLNDRRQIVTKDSDGTLELWDVLQAKKLKNLPEGTNIEDVVKENVRKLWIPSWFSVETKCGVSHQGKLGFL
jgi:WD repeat-containing protein 48